MKYKTKIRIVCNEEHCKEMVQGKCGKNDIFISEDGSKGQAWGKWFR